MVLVKLKSGKVLAGTIRAGNSTIHPLERFTVADGLTIARAKYGTALLPDGKILIAGGQTGGAWGPRSRDDAHLRSDFRRRSGLGRR